MLERCENAVSVGGLAARFAAVRAHSVALAAPLTDEDCCVQSMPDASPVKWHLAHTTWFFETFVLEVYEPGFRAFHPAFRMLFNSYYNGVGEKFARPERGVLTRPSRAEVMAYRANVDARMMALLGAEVSGEVCELVELGLQHEQQHQELILTDVLHLLSRNPLFPVYDAGFAEFAKAGDLRWLDFDPGVVEVGFAGEKFCFDNERPRHRVFLEPFQVASRLVTNGEFLGFVEAGGYERPEFWLSEGWDWVRANGVRHPLYWVGRDEGWGEFGLGGLRALDLGAALKHVSYFEAAAFAQYAGARLPTEFEWEFAVGTGGLEQAFGVAWQWTSSSYAAYPGFVTAAGAIGEYNGKFMVNQYVLRGSSVATPAGHSRATYRNFFPAGARWQFSGVRLAT